MKVLILVSYNTWKLLYLKVWLLNVLIHESYKTWKLCTIIESFNYWKLQFKWFHLSLCDPNPKPSLTWWSRWWWIWLSSPCWWWWLALIGGLCALQKYWMVWTLRLKIIHLGISSVRALKFSLFSIRLGRHTLVVRLTREGKKDTYQVLKFPPRGR